MCYSCIFLRTPSLGNTACVFIYLNRVPNTAGSPREVTRWKLYNTASQLVRARSLKIRGMQPRALEKPYDFQHGGLRQFFKQSVIIPASTVQQVVALAGTGLWSSIPEVNIGVKRAKKRSDFVKQF